MSDLFDTKRKVRNLKKGVKLLFLQWQNQAENVEK